jgi:hypothetical protein
MQKIFLITLTLILGMGMVQNAYALTVSPAKIEITADPGQAVIGEIELFNEQDEVKTFFVSYENFESRGDTGAPYFTGSEGGLATWITTVPEVTLAPGERVQIPYTISIPENTRPGGYFSAIFWGSQPLEGAGGGEVAIGGKVGVLILLRVSGDVDESAGLASFGALQNKRFFSMLPVSLEYNFNNTGGDRVVPLGEVTIKNMFRMTSATFLANENEGSVLPNSTRRFELVWGEKHEEGSRVGFFEAALLQLQDFRFGRYSADIQLSWGESAQTAQSSYSFFIIPWQLLTIVLLVVGLMLFVFRVWMVRLKHSILREAMRTREALPTTNNE